MNSPLNPPRGVLHQRLEHGEFQHTRRAPSTALAGLVEHYWHVSWDLRDLPVQQQETLPHPSVHYVVEPGATAIYGVHTGRYVRTLEGQSYAFGIKFKPGSFYPFYRKAVSSLTDRSVNATEIFAARATRFESDVSNSQSVDEMVTAAEKMLLTNIPPDDPNVLRINTWAANIAADRDITSVEELVNRTGLPKRTLQRLFNEYVGVGPKWVINRYRLHEAIAQLQAGNLIIWADLALKLGYFDQAHFIRDFRKLIGRSPAEYAQSQGKHGR
jgi:AraC-like DNA-binding protein